MAKSNELFSRLLEGNEELLQSELGIKKLYQRGINSTGGMKMKPSNFLSQPMNSILQKSEAETVARNIMVILSRTGDKFRFLSWREYKLEREKDGNFSQKEKSYFEQVVNYCSNEESAKSFSPAWRK